MIVCHGYSDVITVPEIAAAGVRFERVLVKGALFLDPRGAWCARTPATWIFKHPDPPAPERPWCLGNTWGRPEYHDTARSAYRAASALVRYMSAGVYARISRRPHETL